MIPEKLQAARLKILYTHPYLSTVLMQVAFIESTDLPMPTMGVDKHWRLYYHPEFIKNESVAVLAGSLYHESIHLLANHALRAPASVWESANNAMAWNACADAEINDDLRRESIQLPAQAVYPQTLKQPEWRTAEEYWENLPKKTITVCGGCGGGSGTSGVPADWEIKDPADGNRKIGQVEGDLIRQKVAEDIRAAKNRGTIPDHLARWAEAFLDPKIPWQRILASKIRKAIAYQAGKLDYTYRRLGRRSDEFLFPSMQAPKCEVAVVVDTSGSMDKDALDAAVAEVGGILRAACVSRVYQIACDAEVHSDKAITSKKNVDLTGGGGTEMEPGLIAAAKHKVSVVVCLTDGWTPWPTVPPSNARYIVGVIGTGGSGEWKVPDWAEVVEIK